MEHRDQPILTLPVHLNKKYQCYLIITIQDYLTIQVLFSKSDLIKGDLANVSVLYVMNN